MILVPGSGMKQPSILLEIQPLHTAIWVDFGELLLILNSHHNNTVSIFGEPKSTDSLRRKLTTIFYGLKKSGLE